MTEGLLHVAPEVRQALSAARPVVALESTLIAHGLPRPGNLDVARQIEATVRAHGAVPATVAVLGGQLLVGLDDGQLEHLASGEDIGKFGVRDLAPAVALGRDGATTVASTAVLASRAGIAVFATGGLGGVHRGAATSWDESADLSTLADIPVTVVCSGVKSLLDVPATLERLESLSITVIGYRTDHFAGFYLADSGHPISWRVEHPAEVAAVMRARSAAGVSRAALIVANPLPEDQQLDPDLHHRVVAEAVRAANMAGVTGKDVTPYLLSYFHRATGGRSLEANVRIVLRNAALAADIAVAMADR